MSDDRRKRPGGIKKINETEPGMVVHACHPSSGKKLKIGTPWSRPSWAKRETPFLK
jgi:hypothetical protein